jgi:hypothetical protein
LNLPALIRKRCFLESMPAVSCLAVKEQFPAGGRFRGGELIWGGRRKRQDSWPHERHAGQWEHDTLHKQHGTPAGRDWQ